MMPPTPKTWKRLAWNGIRLSVPANWEVTSLASSYLLLDDSESPVLELKWQQVKGRFSHEANLRRLARSSRVAPKVSLHKKSVPESWQWALAGFEVQAFSWTGSAIHGEGAVIYCPTCQTATLVQFYHTSGRIESLVSEQVLHSFRDHGDDGWIAWSLFGPLVIRELRQRGDNAAVEAVAERAERAEQVLDEIMARTWLIINRAPTPTPAKPNSVIGVSTTLMSPNRSIRPRLTL